MYRAQGPDHPRHVALREYAADVAELRLRLRELSLLLPIVAAVVVVAVVAVAAASSFMDIPSITLIVISVTIKWRIQHIPRPSHHMIRMGGEGGAQCLGSRASDCPLHCHTMQIT